MVKVTTGKAAASSDKAVLAPTDDSLVVATDSRGRILEFKALPLWEEMNLLALAGGERSANDRWMQYATIVAGVRKIDGEIQPPPQTMRILEGRIRQVGTDGFVAILKALSNTIPPDIAMSLQADKDSAKN